MEGVFNGGAQMLVDEGLPHILHSVTVLPIQTPEFLPKSMLHIGSAASSPKTVAHASPAKTADSAAMVEGRSTDLKQTFIGCIIKTSLGRRSELFVGGVMSSA